MFLFLLLFRLLPVPFGLPWDHRAGGDECCAVCVPLLRLVLSCLLLSLCVDGTFNFLLAGVSRRCFLLLLFLVSVADVVLAAAVAFLVIWVSLPLRPGACCCLSPPSAVIDQLFRCIMSLGLRICWLCLLMLLWRIIVATFLFWGGVVRASRLGF